MDGIEADTRGVAIVVRVQIQDGAGRAVADQYGIELTPSFVLFDRGGRELERFRSVTPSLTERLRALAP